MPRADPPALSVREGTGELDVLHPARQAIATADDSALAWAVGRISDTCQDLPAWLGAARLLTAAGSRRWARRQLRVAMVGSHTTGHLSAILPVAMARHGIAVDVHDVAYGQYEPQILDPRSRLYAFAPDLVLLLIDERELRFPAVSTDPTAALAQEAARWTTLWSQLRQHSNATIVQTTFVPRGREVLGHLALTTPGSRRRLIRALNLELGDAAPTGVHLLDAELLAAGVGTSAWSDDRYWFLAKQAVGLGALPALCRQLAQITAAAIGLTRKVIVLDLDNTLWGGVIGEDGLAGIVIGNGARGEAYQGLQEHLLALRRRGVLLAVVSKNNDADARQPFLEHPDMRLHLEDFVAFRVGWDDKSTVIAQLAQDLSVGLDAFVFLDDNPFEREAVRRALPDVDVVDLPEQASGYLAALAAHPTLEPGALTGEDTDRAARCQALALSADARAGAATAQEFLAGLDMHAVLTPVSKVDLPRVVQLLGKTNQFNLTGRRHGETAVRQITDQPAAIHFTLRLRDRFGDHGLVGVVLAHPEGSDLRVNTWLMSCRVLGRGVEIATMRVLTDTARTRGFTRVIGEYQPTTRNEPAADAYERSGFTPLHQLAVPPLTAGPPTPKTTAEPSVWVFDLTRDVVPDPGHVSIQNDLIAPS